MKITAFLLLFTTAIHCHGFSVPFKSPDVLCMGEILLEFVALDTNRRLEDVTQWKGVPGGAPANVAVALQRLGRYQSAFVGCVGDDPFGVKLENMFAEDGVNTSYLFRADDGSQTTMVFVAVWDDGRKDLCFYRGADRQIASERISPALFANAKCFHYGSITLIDQPGADAQRRAIQMARDQGLMITYDPNYRPTLWPDEATARHTILDAFQYAHMAKIAEEEWPVATGHVNLEEGIQAVLEQGVELLIVSKGEGGALATNGKFLIESPALEGLDIVETTGAGDAFLSAMITRLLPEFEKGGGTLKHVDQATVQAALDYANIVGGLTCTKPGAIPALPTAAEVEKFVAKRKRQQKPSERLDLPTEAKELAGIIDHTLLKPDYAENDVGTLCEEARRFGFAMVAVNPAVVSQCSQLLHGSKLRVGAAIGFPLGQTTTAVKKFETRDAIQNGATEIDMVMNVRALQSGDYDLVRDEIEAVLEACQESSTKVLCKIILETCYLTNDQKAKACEICRDARVDFVKTSTGFGTGGATVEDVQLMRQTVGDALGVKASGGIRDLATARAMVEAGATRIGTSNGVAIMEELLNELEG